MPADSFALPESGSVSEAVRAAQQKLMELRRSLGIEPRGREIPEPAERRRRTDAPTPHVQDTKYEIRDTEEEGAPDTYFASRASYHSENLAQHLRAAAERRQKQAAADDRQWLTKLRATSDELRVQSERRPHPAAAAGILHSSLVIRHSSLVKVYPDLALGILRRKKAAPGRVWLLLRHHDAAGRGRVDLAEAVRLLTRDGSPLRICGRRQLINLLAAGEGLFWQRDTGSDGREWLRLHSATRVAAGLGVARLGGSPVAVPLNALTGTIGQCRAHLYAAFHSGRTTTDLLTGERRGRGPIARETLCKLSGAVPNSQRNYERRAHVGRRSAIAVGPQVGRADEQELAWRRGRALFHLRDRQGRFGRPGATYLAWQLPNEYTGPHATLPRGRMKRLNRALADLFHDGMTGNDERTERGSDVGQVAGSGAKGPDCGSQRAGNGPDMADCGEKCAESGAQSCASPVASPRRFYGSAKSAALARHDRERYWRYGRVWLWQPEEKGSGGERVKGSR